MHKLLILFSLFTLSLFAIERKEGESDAEYKKRYLKSIGVQEAQTAQPKTEQPVANQDANQQDPNQQDPNQQSIAQNNSNNQNANSGDLDSEVDKAVEDLAGMGGMQKDGEPLEYKNEEVKPVKIKESFLTKMMDSKTKAFLGTMIAKSPFADMKKETIEQVFISRNEGNPLGSFLKNNEKPRKILIDFLHHPRALPNVVSVINKPEKIKYMGIFAAVVLGLAFLANLMNAKGGLIKRILTKVAIGAFAGVLNLGFFVFQFHEEMKPTINIIFKYYHF